MEITICFQFTASETAFWINHIIHVLSMMVFIALSHSWIYVKKTQHIIVLLTSFVLSVFNFYFQTYQIAIYIYICFFVLFCFDEHIRPQNKVMHSWQIINRFCFNNTKFIKFIMLRYIMKIGKKKTKKKLDILIVNIKKNNDLLFDEEGEGMVR